MNVDDIDDNGDYYAGFHFAPNVSESYFKRGRNTVAADEAHYNGIFVQSYGTTLEFVTYDTNNDLLPLLFGHFFGAECYEYCKIVFEAVKAVEGFHNDERMTIVDQDKSIYSAYKDTMKKAHLFMDPLHVKENIRSKLVAAKASGLNLYNQAVYAQPKSIFDAVIKLYSPAQTEYLSKIPKSYLYRA